MGWLLDLLYEAFGTRWPVASYFVIFFLFGALGMGAWWLVGSHYRKTHTPAANPPSAQPTLPTSIAATQQSSATTAEPKKTPGAVKEVAPPLRRPLPQQLATMRSLLRQIQAQGHAEIWLSQVFFAMGTGGLDDIPVGGAVDYPATLRKMAAQGEIEIVESVRRDIYDLWGELFREDIHFRILKLKGEEETKQ